MGLHVFFDTRPVSYTHLDVYKRQPVLHIENKNKQDSLIKVFHRLNEEDIIDKIKKLED